jgi:very-short-patch-repair endonuclease
MNKKEQQQIARDLRSAQTPAERALWEHLRKKTMSGFKFHRQYIIRHNDPHDAKGFFIADFFCPSAKLIIEVDGEIHEHQKVYDHAREQILSDLGLTILRFSNQAVFTNIEDVLTKISNHLDSGSPSLQ